VVDPEVSRDLSQCVAALVAGIADPGRGWILEDPPERRTTRVIDVFPVEDEPAIRTLC
jgi:hypothetical protein